LLCRGRYRQPVPVQAADRRTGKAGLSGRYRLEIVGLGGCRPGQEGQAHAAGKLAVGFWDHWVPSANDTLTKLCQEWAAKEKVEIAID